MLIASLHHKNKTNFRQIWLSAHWFLCAISFRRRLIGVYVMFFFNQTWFCFVYAHIRMRFARFLCFEVHFFRSFLCQSITSYLHRWRHGNLRVFCSLSLKTFFLVIAHACPIFAIAFDSVIVAMFNFNWNALRELNTKSNMKTAKW